MKPVESSAKKIVVMLWHEPYYPFKVINMCRCELRDINYNISAAYGNNKIYWNYTMCLLSWETSIQSLSIRV